MPVRHGGKDHSFRRGRLVIATLRPLYPGKEKEGNLSVAG
jgi:hypothetical protein